MILVLNTGSSSIKFALFEEAGDASAPGAEGKPRDEAPGPGGRRGDGTGASGPARLLPRLAGGIDGIGGEGRLRIGPQASPVAAADHAAALDATLGGLREAGVDPRHLSAVAHRVVHGGALTEPALLTPDTLARIAAAVPLAPLHNPHALAAIAAMRDRAPDLPQVASFDTAFHATNPPLATTYALPAAARAAGIRRYGFHGLSYAGMVRQFGPDLPPRLLALHLGNGVSLCAIRDGRSVATSMGYSPLSGPTMGTRSGDIDAAAVLRLAEAHGIEGAHSLLSRESGLRGLSGGTSDMRALLASDAPEAAFAVAHFCYWAARHAGSLAVALGGVDALAFTGGIGENAAPVRAGILAHLQWLGLRLDPAANDAARAGPAPLRIGGGTGGPGIWVVAADEERQIARDAQALLAGGGGGKRWPSPPGQDN